MSSSLRMQTSIRVMTALSLLLAHQAGAAQAPAGDAAETNQVGTVDVILGGDRVMQGYVVDGQGVPQANVRVALTTSTGEQIATTSDAKGRFGYRGLEGGTYQLATDHGVVLCRAWTAQAAPPRAAATLLMVHDKSLIRGQSGPPPTLNRAVGGMKRVMTNPLAVATIIGAAVAIPVAVHNANQDDSGS